MCVHRNDSKPCMPPAKGFDLDTKLASPCTGEIKTVIVTKCGYKTWVCYKADNACDGKSGTTLPTKSVKAKAQLDVVKDIVCTRLPPAKEFPVGTKMAHPATGQIKTVKLTKSGYRTWVCYAIDNARVNASDDVKQPLVTSDPILARLRLVARSEDARRTDIKGEPLDVPFSAAPTPVHSDARFMTIYGPPSSRTRSKTGHLRMQRWQANAHPIFERFGPWMPINTGSKKDAKQQIPQSPGAYEWSAKSPSDGKFVVFYAGLAEKSLRTRFADYVRGSGVVEPRNENDGKRHVFQAFQSAGWTISYRFCECASSTEAITLEKELLTKFKYAGNYQDNGGWYESDPQIGWGVTLNMLLIR